MSCKIPKTCRQFSICLLGLLICLSSYSQASFDAVDQLFKQNQKTLGNYVALVWKDGKIIYQKQGGTDFTAKSPAPIANLGNWMTAALLMTFVDEGKLSLDDKVTQFIPLFGKYMKGYITVRHCLTNTTGIRTEADIPKAMQKSHFETLEDEINSYASKKDIATNPGTEFFYSNLGPNIAARVLEVVSKKGFDRLMRERITGPLKMRGTSFSNEDGGALNASGGARSTANDYINFLAMLLNKGMFEGKRVLSEKAVEELEKISFPGLPVKYAPKEMPSSAHYGMGAWVLDTNAAGIASALACPSFLTTAAYIDKCRNYGALLLVEKPEEEKKPLWQSMKSLIDQQMPCQ